MAEDKEKILHKFEKELSEFKEVVEGFITSILDKIETLEAGNNHEAIEQTLEEAEKNHRDKISKFKNMLKVFINDAAEAGISPIDGISKTILSKIKEVNNMLQNPTEYMSSIKNKKIEEEKQRVRALEPIDNLGSVDIEVLSKDKLEEQLFQLHDKQEAAISQSEKDQIQNEIEKVLELYKNANIKAWIKK